MKFFGRDRVSQDCIGVDELEVRANPYFDRLPTSFDGSFDSFEIVDVALQLLLREAEQFDAQSSLVFASGSLIGCGLGTGVLIGMSLSPAAFGLIPCIATVFGFSYFALSVSFSLKLKNRKRERIFVEVNRRCSSRG